MKSKECLQLVGYLLLIWVGYIVGQYPHIPTIDILGFHHDQPSIEIYDKCIAFTLFAVYATLLIALHKYFWVMFSLTFMSWGMFNNLLDEITCKNSILSTNEQLSLLFALLTTSILIWRHRRK